MLWCFDVREGNLCKRDFQTRAWAICVMFGQVTCEVRSIVPVPDNISATHNFRSAAALVLPTRNFRIRSIKRECDAKQACAPSKRSTASKEQSRPPGLPPTEGEAGTWAFGDPAWQKVKPKWVSRIDPMVNCDGRGCEDRAIIQWV